MTEAQLPDLLLRTPQGLVFLILALASIGLWFTILTRLRKVHPEAWQKEVRHDHNTLWIHPVDQGRLLGFWLAGEYKKLADPDLTRFCTALKFVWLLIVPVAVWCALSWSGGAR